MVLMECPECKKEISSDAEFCPHCGCPDTKFFYEDGREFLNSIR